MKFERSSGILLHPTSLPGKYGIGDLGESAYKFVDFLVECKQKLWQICPLGPTGYGDSPYQCFSAFAGNPLLVSLDKLVEDGLLTQSELHVQQPVDDLSVNYGPVIQYKFDMLKKAHKCFMTTATPIQRAKFENFCEHQHVWLDDYALFMALKEHYRGAVWNTWGEHGLVIRHLGALDYWTKYLAEQISYQKFIQYLFFMQWLELKAYANRNFIKIIGDIPIFVAFDSADAWSHPDLFFFDNLRKPTYVAGVPPDYFSPTGQLWGNPIYRWDEMKEDGYEWWICRFERTFATVDIIRVDHFRGFAKYWRVPAGETTAVKGSWEPGPGADLFRTVEQALGRLPFIAEDLGVITPDVTALRESCGFPGMKVLQFAFDSDEENEYLPHTFEKNCVVYTGTHDNDTTVGWYKKCTETDLESVNAYLNTDGKAIHWDFIRAAWASTADIAIIPLQDALGLDSSARMNTPATAAGNWKWRFTWDMITPEICATLKKFTKLYGR